MRSHEPAASAITASISEVVKRGSLELTILRMTLA